MKQTSKKPEYGNDSISSLKGADRVRKRPGVIFGSDGLDGCQHAVFEILSNSIDEAREGYGNIITVTRYKDKSIQVEDFGRGCPVDWNPTEKRYNWELVFCELYAGGKYSNTDGENYEYSLGLNGLGSCATQYASKYMDVTVWRDGFKYSLHFEKGEIVGEMQKEPYKGKRTGTMTRWLPDLDVFTDIDIPVNYYLSLIHIYMDLSLSIIASIPLYTVFSNPSSRTFITPSMVVPAGEHTWSTNSMGWVPSWRISATHPCTDCMARSRAAALGRPPFTPAVARASIYINVNAMEEPHMAVKTEN